MYWHAWFWMVLGHPSISRNLHFAHFNNIGFTSVCLIGSWRQAVVVYLGNMGSKLGRVFFALINFKYLWGSKKTWHVEKHCVWTFLDTSKWRLCCSENDDDQPWDFGYFLTKDVPLFGPMAFRRVAVRSIEIAPRSATCDRTVLLSTTSRLKPWNRCCDQQFRCKE